MGVPLDQAGPDELAGLLECASSDQPLWRMEDLGGILAHQLGLPLGVQPGLRLVAESTEAANALALTLRDVLHGPGAPSVELLAQIKQFAKQQRLAAEAALPREICTVLYYGSIAAALVRRGQRISRLSDDELVRGMSWMSGQSWVDAETRSLAREAVAALGGQKPPVANA